MENIEEIEADLKSLVLDSRFDLTDDRLITHYLRKMIANQYVPPCLIADDNLYQHHPKDLPESYPHLRLWLVDEWYFFLPRDLNESRAAGNGYWKATGADKPVNNVNDETVGFKQELVFYEGKGEKTNWIMHAYAYKEVENIQRSKDMMLDDWVLISQLDEWVLCRIYYDKVQKPVAEEDKKGLSAETNLYEEYIPDNDDIVLQNNYPGGSFPSRSFVELEEEFFWECMSLI